MKDGPRHAVQTDEGRVTQTDGGLFAQLTGDATATARAGASETPRRNRNKSSEAAKVPAEEKKTPRRKDPSAQKRGSSSKRKPANMALAQKETGPQADDDWMFTKNETIEWARALVGERQPTPVDANISAEDLAGKVQEAAPDDQSTTYGSSRFGSLSASGSSRFDSFCGSSRSGSKQVTEELERRQ